MKNDKIKSMLSDLKEVCYMGEEGDMATTCKTKRGAWIKFRNKILEDVGPEEKTEILIENVGIAYARLPTKKDIDKWGKDEHEFYVGQRKTPYKVWYYYDN